MLLLLLLLIIVALKSSRQVSLVFFSLGLLLCRSGGEGTLCLHPPLARSLGTYAGLVLLPLQDGVFNVFTCVLLLEIEGLG